MQFRAFRSGGTAGKAAWLAGSLLAAAILLGIWAESSPAGGVTSFRTQEGNIQCAYIALDPMLGGRSVRCDVLRRLNRRPRRPASCNRDWGVAYEVRETGRGRILCVSDTVANRRARRLIVKRTYRYGPFRCRSTRTTMRCYRGSNDNGFLLGLRRQTVY